MYFFDQPFFLAFRLSYSAKNGADFSESCFRKKACGSFGAAIYQNKVGEADFLQS